MPEFIPGLELSRQFYVEVVKPILDAEFPDLRYDAALIDPGSEVLGFDTHLSRDHAGVRVVACFCLADDLPPKGGIDQPLRRGYRIGFAGTQPASRSIPGETHPRPGSAPRRRSRSPGLDCDCRDAVRGYLGFDLDAELTPADWLSFPQQKLHDTRRGLPQRPRRTAAPARAPAYYPRDVWLYLMAAGWMRISQEEPFVGRAGDVGDELGSRFIAGRPIRDLMMLGFLTERVYAPYSKWFGTGFSRLECAVG